MLNNPLRSILDKNAFLVLDGAMATELEARGCNLADSLWSAKVLMENPEQIYQVHLDYFRAGARCAITASYQATPRGFAKRGIAEPQALGLIADSVRLALQARETWLRDQPDAGPLLVAGSVGPWGAMLADGSEYRGDYREDDAAFQDFHRPRIAALVDAGVDLLALETQPSFAEIQALCRLLAEFPDTVAWLSVTLQDTHHLSDGTPLETLATWLQDWPQIVALGINCIALEQTGEALRQLHRYSHLPLVVYPNSGEQYDAVTKTWHTGTSHGHELDEYLDEWLAAGARLIGGCCRTTPQDIARLAGRCKH